MQITLTLDISPTTSQVALHQLLDWAHRINSGETVGDANEVVETKPNGVAARNQSPKEKALIKQLLDTQTPPAPPAPPTVVLSETGTDENGEGEEQEAQGDQVIPAGALPPGVESPVKKKGGRPSKAMLEERARLASEEAAKVNPALVPQQPAQAQGNGALPPGMGNGARPPGMNPAPAQVQPQMPAMPQQEEYSNGAVDLEALRKRFAEAIGVNPQATTAIMRAPTWPNGESKPVWYAISNVVPMHFDALYGELGSLLPAGG